MTLAGGRKGSRLVLAPFACRRYHPVMTDAADALMPASPDDLAELHPLEGHGGFKRLESFGWGAKGRHYSGVAEAA